VGSLMIGSGTFSTVTFRRPCHVTARIRPPHVRLMSICPLDTGKNLRARQETERVNRSMA
jgi:hypothetical protein